MPDIEADLNQTITAAVNARVEAEMMRALSGDETIGKFVLAALRQPVKKNPNAQYGNESRETETYLTQVLRKAIQASAKSAVEKFVNDEIGTIEDEVRKALRRDVRSIAETLTKSLVDSAATSYGVNVKVDLKTRGT